MSDKSALLEALFGDIVSDVKSGAESKIEALSKQIDSDIAG